ncbi:MAG: hypothetical protein U0931_25055 [Vulcanimicrobiota bacterium]
MKKLLLWVLVVTLPALAQPEAGASQKLVRRIIGYSLKTYKNGDRGPDLFEAVAKHPEDFAPEYFSLMKFTSQAQPEHSGGKAWLWEVDPIWLLQNSGVKALTIGDARKEGQNLLVPVNFTSPSGISAQRPATHYKNLWVISQLNGRPVLSDVRYSAEYTKGVRSVLDELRQVKISYDKRNHK